MRRRSLPPILILIPLLLAIPFLTSSCTLRGAGPQPQAVLPAAEVSPAPSPILSPSPEAELSPAVTASPSPSLSPAATETPAPTPVPYEGEEIAQYARQFDGGTYRYAGKDPATGFDCSGLVYYVYRQFGYRLNRVAADQATNGIAVEKLEELLPGDILCFSWHGSSYINHAGIYIGEGDFIHAMDSAHGVLITSVEEYLQTHDWKARRIVGCMQKFTPEELAAIERQEEYLIWQQQEEAKRQAEKQAAAETPPPSVIPAADVLEQQAKREEEERLRKEEIEKAWEEILDPGQEEAQEGQEEAQEGQDALAAGQEPTPAEEEPSEPAAEPEGIPETEEDMLVQDA